MNSKWAIGIVVACVGLLALSHLRVVRWDLTDDKHYSLSASSKNLLRQTDAPIEVTLLLDGDLNAGFRRLKKATEETVAEMGVYGRIQTAYADRIQSTDRFTDSLGLTPIVIHEREQNGKTAQTTVYPYALMRYKGKRAVVTLLKNTRGLSGEENLNASIEQLEFAFMEALHLLMQTQTPRVAILEGHNEPDEAHTYDLMTALSKYFAVDRGAIENTEYRVQSTDLISSQYRVQSTDLISSHVLDGYKAVLIIAPQTAFSDAERFVIDQYIMRGGTVLWALDGVRFSE